jgi:hypothetical protein
MQEKHNLRRCAKLLPTKLALESKLRSSVPTLPLELLGKQ